MSTIRHSAAIAECGCRLQDTGVGEDALSQSLKEMAKEIESND